MKTFQEFISEGKDEAKAIREILKKELGLSAKDVSVRTKKGGYSKAVRVNIKTMKALALKSKIEEVGSKFRDYDRDEATGEILAGGNTFIFVEIDWDFEKSLKEKIQKDFVKEFEKTDSNEIVLYKKFEIRKYQEEDDTYFVYIKGKHASKEVKSAKNYDFIGSAILSLISSTNDDSLYELIK